ncbi:hypothetical protein [Massilia genomosp. 1]|uniref:Uncharacterized protein n=1 Tax=Massilia genomosp. 1 TaxID=2609280 RepID=A0ABX0MLN6_9BURK|nr:hypothetical protein [Massilia genomosp. 1]NHZ61371.1 hypothetical protein [Massilia genomosp. 1]
MTELSTLPLDMRNHPPKHGWIGVSVTIGAQVVEIDASDVPNNPVADLLDALDLAAHGLPSRVWWHLEPDGYFMCFTPAGDQVHFRIDFAPDSDAARAYMVVQTVGSRAHVLLPFWRFVRNFHACAYTEPHWPRADFSRIDVVEARIKQA